MSVSDADMVRAWTHVLTLSNLKPGNTVTLLTSAGTHPQTLRTAGIAAGLMGAVVNRLDLPPMNAEHARGRDSLAYLGTTPLTGNRAAITALKESDIVLDLTTLLLSPEQAEILESGTRILLAVEPPEVLVRLLPSLEDKERVGRAAALMAAAKEMTVTSKAGTDLRLPQGEFPAIQEYGFVDAPGRWDHWPSGFGTSLAPWLTQKGVETLLVAGCTTSGCVRASVVDAMGHGFRPVVLSDCVGDVAPADRVLGL